MATTPETSVAALAKYEPVIGLEVHVQLLTATKIFCSCSTRFGDPPNTNVCPVCLGLPGALPVLNQRAVEFAALAAMALNCRVHETSIFARKNYFYPDLPKGYQISQYDKPLAEFGWVDISARGGTKRIGITRLHLEEDAGKSLHEGFPDATENTAIDLNRSGVPLIEIVSEPDLASPDEAYEYLTRLKEIVLYTGVSDCNMEEGSLRCDANVSVRPRGQKEFGTKTEVKNVNSFRFIREALVYEIERQVEIVESGGKIAQETRLYNSSEGKTYGMRSKEQAHDYRYFPEPDLPPLRLDAAFVERVRATLPELPEARAHRFQEQYGLTAYDAAVLTDTRGEADTYEALVTAGVPAKLAANWLSGDVAALANEHHMPLQHSGLGIEGLATLLLLVDAGTINGPTAKDLLAELYVAGGNPEALVRDRGLAQVSDTAELSALVDAAIAANPAAAADFRAGKQQALGQLMRAVKDATSGKADMPLVNRLLRDRLSEQ